MYILFPVFHPSETFSFDALFRFNLFFPPRTITAKIRNLYRIWMVDFYVSFFSISFPSLFSVCECISKCMQIEDLYERTPEHESKQDENDWTQAMNVELQFRLVFVTYTHALTKMKKFRLSFEFRKRKRSLCCANNYLLKHHPIAIYSFWPYKMFEVLQVFSLFLSIKVATFVCRCLCVCVCDNFKIQHLPKVEYLTRFCCTSMFVMCADASKWNENWCTITCF